MNLKEHSGFIFGQDITQHHPEKTRDDETTASPRHQAARAASTQRGTTGLGLELGEDLV